jgi:hypothetical protein
MRRSFRWVCAARVAATTALLASPAVASPDGVVVTTGGDRHDVVARVLVDYGVEIDRSRLVRERVGNPDADPLGGVPVRQDLDALRTRHTLTPRLELGVGPNVWLWAGLPVVLADDRELSLHDGVSREGSSTLQDGILPSAGYDAKENGAGFAATDDRVFRGQRRSGLDQVIGGIGVALMNQRRDLTKPTWKLGVEGRFAVGKVARFDAMDPGANTAVGRGVHELRLWTTVAKRVSFVETYFGAAWQVPVVTKDASPFRDLGYGSINVDPPQQAELKGGLEAAVFERPKDDLRVGVDVGGRLVAIFEGRDYSEMWEALAIAGDARRPDAPLVLDADPVAAGRQGLSHPGISNIENHLEMSGNLAVRAQLGKNFQLALLAEVIWKTDHSITFADAGVDLPTCDGGQTAGCEVINNDLIDAGTEEENPAFVAEIDLVGHRYRSVDGLGLVLGVQATGSF